MIKINLVMKMKISFSILFVFFTVFCEAQKIEGELSTIENNGLYKIKVPSIVRSYSKEDLDDFRIWDNKQQQVPYFIYKPVNETIISNFAEFEILSQTNLKDTSSIYIFKNPKERIEKLILLTANYNEAKSFNLQGSYNQKKWYGLVNKQQISNLSSSSNTSVYKAIEFPLCSYPFLKIVFDDKNSLPINLLKIGTANTKVVKNKPDEITVKSIDYKALPNNKTQIHITFKQVEIIEQVTFEVSFPQYFDRAINIYSLKTRALKKKGTEVYKNEIAHFSLNSEQSTTFTIPLFTGDEFYIEIENEDNQQLEISSLKFYQNPLYIVTDLKQHELYTFSSGLTKVNKPNYDLSNFKNNILNNLAVADLKAIKINQNEVKKVKPLSVWQQPWFLWLCIGIAGLIIVYFVLNLIKDLKNDSTT